MHTHSFSYHKLIKMNHRHKVTIHSIYSVYFTLDFLFSSVSFNKEKLRMENHTLLSKIYFHALDSILITLCRHS